MCLKKHQRPPPLSLPLPITNKSKRRTLLKKKANQRISGAKSNKQNKTAMNTTQPSISLAHKKDGADPPLELYGLRTLIATAPITATSVDALTRSLFEQTTDPDVKARLNGAVLFVFAPWCGCCQNFVSEYNRMVALLPIMTNSAVGWIPDHEVLNLRNWTTNQAVQQIGNGVQRLPSVFFLNDKGVVTKGTMQSLSDPLIDAYLASNPAAKQHADTYFWPALAKAISA